jgi:Ca-activated chloride channel family protein
MNWANPNWFNGFWLVLLLILFLFWREGRRKRELEKFVSASLWGELVNADYFRRRLKWALLLAAVLFLVLALARPQKRGDLVKVERKGIDLIIALDTSGSMRAQDFKPDRFAKAKREISSLISHLKGDRVGIVVFSGVSFLQCPLTIDYRAAKLFAEAMEVDMLPRPGTAIGDAIRTAVRAFEHQGPQKKAIILKVFLLLF